MKSYNEVEYPEGINQDYSVSLIRHLIEHLSTMPYPWWGTVLDIGGSWMWAQAFNRFPYEYTDNFNAKNYRDEEFEIVFSKSTLEHINDTALVLAGIKKVLANDGVAVFLVPDWDSQKDSFYDDSTHVKPFTKKSLEMAFKLAGFKEIKCDYFYQLPFLWKRPWLKPLVWLMRLVPYRWRMINKHVRFSNETMLLLTARK